MPSIRNNKVNCQDYRSEIEVTIEIISGKWVALILLYLNQKEVVRFNEFTRVFPELTQKVLSQQLKKLEDNKMICKHIHPVVPPKVEYRLSENGQSIILLLEQMQEWGRDYIRDYHNKKF